ncbi:kinase-like protein [Teratosphaeria nubilosa]|uniref:non-specific serine/threonine protein kinase n=1 Tax=Teratosphaeria nubilosa TaxID=161662 RepID=A0A6G1LCL2_9PEZI|nr:kinase-like protein [Teratosphaeria nubilosa]
MAEAEEEKYDVLQKIGQGSFGIIRKVRRRADGQILCRKEISYSRMSEKERSQLAAELDILKNLRHPNVVQYYTREHIKSSQDIHLYMEYCGNGDLGGYIKGLKDRNKFADEEFAWGIFAQLVSALYRCHYGEDAPRPGEEGQVGKGRKPLQSKEGHRVILHRDLKPENVFLGTNNAVKLGDFGLSKIIASHDFASTYVGTPFYMSPEICAAERYSHHSDVWSLGCIIYELCTRCVPFDARSHVELVMKIKAGKIKTLPSGVYGQELWDVIQWCLKVDPNKRPDTAQLLNVPQIRDARRRLETSLALEKANQERDSAVSKLNIALKQIQELQQEVQTLKEAGKKIEMEWHAKATLAIDQRVAEAAKKQGQELEREKASLRSQFDAAVEQQVDEKLRLHQASLPQNHGLSQHGDVAAHVRSNTPPPGKSQSSFATATTAARSDASSIGQGLESSLDSDISSLSIMEEPDAEDASPLAQRTKPPPKTRRQAFGRAKTLANYSFNEPAAGSPMDVHMADPSPMPNHVAPMSIKGLSLSPRRNGAQQDRMAGAGLRKNIFALANEPKLRPLIPGEHDSSFADEDLIEDDEDDIAIGADSPSRPSSGLSNKSVVHGGDPFKALAAGEPVKPPVRKPRPSLGRQQTMPVQHMNPLNSRARTNNIFGPRGAAKAGTSPEKENRPPSSYSNGNGAGRSNVPVSTASPKRPAATGKDGKVLTPSRKAPAPPTNAGGLPRAATAGNLARLAHGNALQSPGKAGIMGRTLVELSQGKAGGAIGDNDAAMSSAPTLLPAMSPAKWDPSDEDMPSPFLAKKGRMGVVGGR